MKESKINIVDLLLAQDASKIRDLPTAQIRITRLSDIIGADFCLEIRALTGAEIESMPDGMEGIDRKILTAVKNFDFTDAQLRGKFTPDRALHAADAHRADRCIAAAGRKNPDSAQDQRSKRLHR